MGSEPFISLIHRYIAKHALIPPSSKIIIGLSGGPDSIFLLHLLASARKSHTTELIAAYLDHEWRPESSQEAFFCKQICDTLSVPFFTKKISELTNTHAPNGSKEEYARRMRRSFLEAIKREQTADLIALAHHAQDQEETFFIRLIRGSAVTGLAAMRPKHTYYIRPLLETNKTDIVTYLDNHSLPYLTDPSNNSLNFLRNRIRHLVIPSLHQCDTRSSNTIQRTIHQLQETELFLEQLTHTLFDQITTDTPDHGYVLNIPQFQAQKPFIQYRLILHFIIQNQVPFTPTQAFLQEIIRFLHTAGNKTHRLHTRWSLIKKEPWASIKKQIL